MLRVGAFTLPENAWASVSGYRQAVMMQAGALLDEPCSDSGVPGAAGRAGVCRGGASRGRAAAGVAAAGAPPALHPCRSRRAAAACPLRCARALSHAATPCAAGGAGELRVCVYGPRRAQAGRRPQGLDRIRVGSPRAGDGGPAGAHVQRRQQAQAVPGRRAHRRRGRAAAGRAQLRHGARPPPRRWDPQHLSRAWQHSHVRFLTGMA
jgi:hypothetical protein